jgi:hypothetical protein
MNTFLSLNPEIADGDSVVKGLSFLQRMSQNRRNKRIETLKSDGVNLEYWQDRSGGNTFNYKVDLRGREILKGNNITATTRHNMPIRYDVIGFLSGLIDTDGTITKAGSMLITGHENLKQLCDDLVALGVPGVKFYLYRRAGVAEIHRDSVGG